MISLCVISKYPELLNRMLSVTSPYVGEIVIVDGENNNEIRQLSNKYGGKYYYHKWENDFSKQRNFSIEKASGDWILVLDDDEVPSFELLNYIYNIDKNNADNFDILRIKYKDFYRYSFNSHVHENSNYRFYKRSIGFKYENKVHEAIDVSKYKSVKVFDLPIESGIIYHEKTFAKQEESDALYKLITNGNDIIQQTTKREN